MSEAPDFSPLAGSYARARPGYPAALYAWLAQRLERRELAWDAATGNGQAALGLAEHFDRVVATDRSAEQIARGAPHPRVDYRVAASESSGLDDASVDLVTVAAALHWFDHAAFFEEVRRVVRPGGAFAAWSYHAGRVEAPFDEVFDRFYWRLVKPYFAAGADHVDARYETIAMPGEPVPAPAFAIEVEWSLDQLLDYVGSWSAVASYRAATGEDPADRIRGELERIFAEQGERLTVRMPLFLHFRRL